MFFASRLTERAVPDSGEISLKIPAVPSTYWRGWRCRWLLCVRCAHTLASRNAPGWRSLPSGPVRYSVIDVSNSPYNYFSAGISL